MSGTVIEAEADGELAAADSAAASPQPAPVATSLPTSTVSPAPPLVRALPSAAMPSGRSPQTSAVERVQLVGNRALAEMVYQIQRVSTATLAGVAALVLAAIIFITGTLPQNSAVTALKGELARRSLVRHGIEGEAPSGAILGSLPERAEVPSVVAKILEEAQASGVELPRGQYEYIPARDGVAARYRMTFPVSATYPKIREFMDRTLVALPAVAIEGLRIERKNVGDDSVDAELKLAAYVRSDP